MPATRASAAPASVPFQGVDRTRGYFARVWNGIRTTAVGMRLTLRHFFTKPTTVQYPEEQPYFSPYERGLHEFEPDKCIVCHLCAKACPVECIDIQSVAPAGKKVLTGFTIDYAKCLFCALCVDPCPVDCIHMGQQYDLSSFERVSGTLIDFTKGEGPWRTARTSGDPEAGLHAETRSRPLPGREPGA
jgi:NADH-quinone oxidoreductase subunit I